MKTFATSSILAIAAFAHSPTSFEFESAEADQELLPATST